MSKTNWTNFVHLLEFENNKFSPQKYLFSVYVYTCIISIITIMRDPKQNFWFYLWFLHMTYSNTHTHKHISLA